MNIQKTIIEGIRSSLLAHDYLVLPDFGGFVLKSRFAHFDSGGGNLLPPSKTLSFNVQLKQNDGILATCLQAELNCTAAEALLHLKEFSAYCFGVLQKRRRLSLEGIGFFFMDFENNICFEPQLDVNFESASFGLGPVQLKPLTIALQKEKTERREFVFEDRPITETEKLAVKPTKQRNYRPLIVPLALLLLVFVFLSTLLSNRILIGPLKASIGGENTQGLYQAKPYPSLSLLSEKSKMNVYLADANGYASIRLESGKNLAVQVTSNSDLNMGNTVTEGKYEIVLGCFSKLDNAKRLVKNLRKNHLNAAIHGQNAKGMHIVSIGSYEERELAVKQLSSLKETYTRAWIRSGE